MAGKLWWRAELVGRIWDEDTELTNKVFLLETIRIASRSQIREGVKQTWKKVGTW